MPMRGAWSWIRRPSTSVTRARRLPSTLRPQRQDLRRHTHATVGSAGRECWMPGTWNGSRPYLYTVESSAESRAREKKSSSRQHPAQPSPVHRASSVWWERTRTGTQGRDLILYGVSLGQVDLERNQPSNQPNHASARTAQCPVSQIPSLQ